MFISEKTGRGPLTESWLEDYWQEVKGKKQPTSKNMSLMCAYKLCRVEFRYWGMQTKLEKFIHDVALRKTMVRAHRQAWAWQDEWHGLTMDDIREIERQTQLALKKKMGAEEGGSDDETTETSHQSSANQFNSIEKTEENSTPLPTKRPSSPKRVSGGSSLQVPVLKQQAPSIEESSDEDDDVSTNSLAVENSQSNMTKSKNRNDTVQLGNKKSVYGSKGALPSPVGSAHSFDLQVSSINGWLAGWSGPISKCIDFGPII
jgi:membrane-associated phosphatidylinositol transfer protein